MPLPPLLSNLRAAYPPTPTLTEKNLPNQAGKVFIVTGSTSGVGKELAQILYSHDAKVYIAARSEEKATKVIEEIEATFPDSKGALVFLHLDLDDLATIKKSAKDFLTREDRLDVLWNNAGVMVPPAGSKTKQGYELQLGTNCVAPFLFTKLLTPLLAKTAKSSTVGNVRVVWVSSSAADLLSPCNGIDMENLDNKTNWTPWKLYGVSKAGNWYHGSEYALRHKEDGIVSLVLNPGNLRSDLQRHLSSWEMATIAAGLYAPIYGAYTELFAGLSPDVTIEKTGSWSKCLVAFRCLNITDKAIAVQPWGRFVNIRSDLAAGAKSENQGGTGVGAKFWSWTEEQVKPYL